MASPSLALPGVLFVGEDERARLVAHLGPAAGWMIPKGVLGWSHEVSVVARDALSDSVRRDAKIVMPEEQIPQAKMPLTHQAALKSPLVSVSSRLTQKLVDAGIRVHTVGADRVTSSFYYIAEGGGEAPIRVEGDLVAAVGAMLGERADNAAIERVLDGLVDRLLRSLSKDRVAELSLELAAALPRAASDGTGTNDVDLESFEKELAALVGTSDKYTPFLREIATKISDTNERRVDIPLYGDARKVSQGPFELMVGDQKVALVTHERWLATGPLTEPAARAPEAAAPAPKAEPKAEPKIERKPEPKPATPRPAPAATAPPANIKPLAAPLNPPRPTSNPPAKEVTPTATAKSEAAPVTGTVKMEAVPAKADAGASAPVTGTVKMDAVPAKAEAAPAAKEAAPAPKEAAPAAKEAAPAPKAEEAKPSPEPAKAKAKAKAAEAEPESKPTKAKAAEPRPLAKDADAEALAEKPKKGGIPWLWILVAIAAAFAAYRFLGKH